jgi:hypothetical protein
MYTSAVYNNMISFKIMRSVLFCAFFKRIRQEYAFSQISLIGNIGVANAMLCDILHATCQTRVFFHFHIHVIGTNHFFYLYISGRRCSWYTTMDCGYLYALSTMLWMVKLETTSAILLFSKR